MTELEGRTAFITGGARGIGLGIARAFARAGVKVAIVDRDEPSVAEAGAELAQLTEVEAHVLDVTDREAYARVAEVVEAALGRVSLLVNNAGIADSTSPSRATYEAWDRMVDVNLHGVYNGIQTFVPGMLARGESGHIINTASEAGVVAEDAGYQYHATKFAVVALSESLRAELGPRGIGVGVLCPGPVATHIMENTLRSRPEGIPAHSARVAGILGAAHEWLLTQGVSPDLVGELVAEAVREDRPWIFTRNALAADLERRTADMVAAMHHAEAVFSATVG